MAKDKKKKKDKKTGSAKTAASLKFMTHNPLVADVVAAALVATAAALKNPDKARQLASQAGDEISALAKGGAQRGNAMWQLALDVGRQALDTFSGDVAKTAKAKRTAKPAKRSKTAKPAKPTKAAKPAKRTKAAKPAKSAKSPKRSTARTKAN